MYNFLFLGLKTNNDAISDLLYVLCTTQDNFTRDRIETMLRWVESLHSQIEQNNCKFALDPISGHLKCLASILWQAYATTLVPDLPNMITKSLFDTLCRWNQHLAPSEAVKRAIDAMLCSICCIRPEMFTMLLRQMGVLVPSISDDRKENYMTDDSKQEASEWTSNLAVEDLTKLFLGTEELKTIAMACQSPLAIQLLIDSGLPRLFTFAILEFCNREMKKDGKLRPSSLTDSAKADPLANYPMVDVIEITDILNFFSEVCSEGTMRDWLGSYEGAVFWEPLLHLLCNNKIYSPGSGSVITPQPYLKLEEAVIKFLSRVTTCHPKNQETFTTTLIYAIRKSDHTDNNNTNSYKLCISGKFFFLILGRYE